MTESLQRLEAALAPLLPRAVARDRLRLLDWLSQPLDLNGAGALSGLLGRPRNSAVPPLHPDQAAAARVKVLAVRAALLQKVADGLASAEPDGAEAPEQARGSSALESPPGIPRRQRFYAQQQREMELRIHGLRAELRAQLRDASPALAQLAALDETLGQGLAKPLEKACNWLPALVAGREDVSVAELQALLLAELETRLQPVFGLLAALEEHTEGN